ncbi:TadE/TadG family type IV pilus assembly protein [Virgibacillus indicus]|nr:TadE/TadG family type IV pilus assembly protein [Virgibacillus indicus]
MKFVEDCFQKLRKSERGNFTIEASLIFPILLMLTLCLVFLSLVIYQKSALHYSANSVAERLAFIWDNSYKDISDGSFDKYTTFDGGDGLYWRVTDNQFLSQFGISIFSGSSASVPIGSGGGGGLPQKKLSRASSGVLPAGATGTVEYENGLAGSNIKVTLTSPLNLPSSVLNLFGISEIKAEVSHAVVEPTEFIRTTDLVIYAIESIKDYSQYITQFMNRRR